MNLQNLKSLLTKHNCQKIYYKILAANDNSKNQPYFGGNFEMLNILPLGDIVAGEANKKGENFKASLDFNWIGEDGNIYPAPGTQLILYPQYPEIRFSGFLKKCANPPSELMTQRLAGRVLILSVTSERKVLGYVVAPNSEIATEIVKEPIKESIGVFNVIDLAIVSNSKRDLLNELRRIHLLGWITSKRLNKQGEIAPCLSPNCGGYTLEAELGIIPNGRSEPDYKGWEVKQFGVANFNRLNSQAVTLMTPEPTGGLYVEKGVDYFIRNYGYADKNGVIDRMNFGGVHKVDDRHKTTGLQMSLIGFDGKTGKISSTDGMIALIDGKDNIAASWSFSSMLKHWNRKHNQACYVPSISETTPERRYQYGNKVALGSGTNFQLFLKEMFNGNIYYDPGIKMENISTNPLIKRRSQFRIKSQHLINLYTANEIVTL